MKKVLVVEDNDLNMKLFHDLLVMQKYQVIASHDGVGVNEIATQQQPSLILMDIQLGGVSGVDLIRQLKSNPATKHIPIIAVTAFAMKHDEARIATSGCDLYLPKPVSIENFFSAIKDLVESSE